MCDSIVINGGNVSIQISGGPGVTEIQSGLATAAAVAALATSVAGREQALSVNAPNHIAVTVDLSSATWNTVATHEVFTVTGAVRMRMWVECTESLAGDGKIAVVSESAASVFPDHSVNSVDAGHLLTLTGTSTSDSDFPVFVADKIVNGHDIGLKNINDPATDGILIFHCVWEPLSAGATVVAGAGGPL